MANGEKPTYRVFVSRKVGDKNFYSEIGAAWAVSNDGISVKLYPGLAVSGDFVMFPPKNGE